MSKTIRFTAILLLCNIITGMSFTQQLPTSARSAAMGHASTALSDVWSSFNNQAGLAWLEGVNAGMFYELHFLAPELSKYGLALAIRVKKAGVFGMSFTRYGYSQYNENNAGITYSRAFGKVFSLGIRFNLHVIQVGDVYGNRITGTGEISFQVKPRKKWVIAAYVFNPTRTPLSDFNREKIATLFRIGTAYQFHEKVLVSIEAEAGINMSPAFRAGVEYHLAKPLYVRIGICSNPVTPSFGAGIKIKRFLLDAAAQWQPLLGFSPQLSLAYDFGAIPKKK